MPAFWAQAVDTLSDEESTVHHATGQDGEEAKAEKAQGGGLRKRSLSEGESFLHPPPVGVHEPWEQANLAGRILGEVNNGLSGRAKAPVSTGACFSLGGGREQGGGRPAPRALQEAVCRAERVPARRWS